MNKNVLTALTVAVISGSFSLQAQSVKDSLQSKALEEVIIVSSRSPKQISEIPGTVWIIDSKQIQQQIRGGAGLKEVLGALIPSLDFGNQGRTNYAQNMRGRNVLVLLNGVSLNSARAVSRQFDAIDPFNIERIEVLSGASAVYGGDATGGAINIVTKKAASDKLAFETSLGVKSGLRHSDDHDSRIAQSIEGGNHFMKFRLGAAYTHNAGAFDANGKRVITDVKQSDLQYNQSVDVLGSLDFKLAENQSLSFDFQHYISKVRNDRWLSFGKDYSGITQNDPDLIQVLDGAHSDIVPSTVRRMLNLQYNLKNILGGQQLLFQAFVRNEAIDFGASFAEVPKAPTGINIPRFLSSARSNTEVYGLKAVLHKQWDNLSLTYGVDADRDNFNGDQSIFNPQTSSASGGLINTTDAMVGRYPHTVITGISGFAQAEWKLLEKLTLSGGIRQQHTNVRVDDFIGFKEQIYMHFGYGSSADAVKGGKNDYNVTLLNGSLLYKINIKQQAWFTYSQGFAVPDAAKSYGFGKYELVNDHWNLLNSIAVSEKPLSGIKTDQFELGWRHNSASGFYAQGSLFYALSNKTLKIDNTAFTISLLDQKLRNYGLEAALGYRFVQGLEVGGNVLLMASETETANDGWQNQSVYTTNPSKFMAFAGWNHKRFSVRLQGQHSMNYTDLTSATINGYTLFDLIGDVKFLKGTVNFGVQNLLNRDYTTIWGQRSVFFYQSPRKAFEYFGRGRTFSLGYTFRF